MNQKFRSTTTRESLKSLLVKHLIFWDFDGVLKDSIEVKGNAFVDLFAKYGRSVTDAVKEHHRNHGGVSRYDKIPIYLGWAGECVTSEKIRDVASEFSELVIEGVVQAPWVHGAREYILTHYEKQIFVIVTATPREEMSHILSRLEIEHCFDSIYGSETKKSDAVRLVIDQLSVKSDDALFIGDSRTDYEAARVNDIPFILRRHASNVELLDTEHCEFLDHFADE